MVGDFVIPINNLQAKIYQVLSELDVKVYDEVPQEAKMPLIGIGDYSLSSLECKDDGFSFLWTINIYTEYEGKKQVNELVSKTMNKLNSLINASLSEEYSINDILLESGNVNRLEGFYVANLSIRIEIN